MDPVSCQGVGPSILLAALSYVAVGAIVTYFWPDTCLNRVISYQVILLAGANFLT
jgi:hypothetical protein